MTNGLSEYVVVLEKKLLHFCYCTFPQILLQYCNISITQNLIELLHLLQLLHFYCNRNSIMQMLGSFVWPFIIDDCNCIPIFLDQIVINVHLRKENGKS